MRSIDIQTTQNVLINYELAPLRDRVLAFIIDVVVIVAANILLSLALGYTVVRLIRGGELLLFLVLGLVTTFYTLFFEVFNRGQTLGKMALRIQVVRLNGTQVTFTDLLLRWVFRLIDIWFSFGAIAVVIISSNRKGQRLGDVVANTAVVRSEPRLEVTLKDVLQINTSENYTPVYPAVRQLKEEDVLAIKQVVDRSQRYRNAAHDEMLTFTAKRLSALLAIHEVPEDREAFLKTLIKDYIVLTR